MLKNQNKYKVLEISINTYYKDNIQIEVFNNEVKIKERFSIIDFLKLYKEDKNQFDISGDITEEYLKEHNIYSFNYVREPNKLAVKDFSKFLESESNLENLVNKDFKIYLDDKCYIISSGFKFVKRFRDRDMITSAMTLINYQKTLTPEEQIEFKNIKIDDSNGDMKLIFNNKIQKRVFLLKSRNLFKNKIFDKDLMNDYKIKNKTNLYFLINTLEDFNFLVDGMSNENKNFFKQLDNMNESFSDEMVSDNQYVNNVNGFIKRNSGKAVIADSTSQKEEAVTVYLNTNTKNNLIVGKPESLEKYQSLGLKNANYIKNTVFSSSKNIIEIKTKEGSVIKYNDKSVYVNDELLESDVTELNVEKNGEINYTVKKENEEEEKKEIKNQTTHYFITEETKKIIEENKNVDSFVLSDAEKIKDSKSLMFYSLLGVVENLNVENKLFVSSNPIYNTIKEIEPLLTILDKDLLEEIKNVINDYSSRDLKGKKDEFLLKILKKYILKREKDELKLMVSEERSNTIKETKYINKRVGILKEETEYYENIKKGIDKYLKDIIKFSLKRVENRELNDNKKNYYIKDLDYYMGDYDKFQVLQGKKLSVEQKFKISRVLERANLKEEGVTLYDSKRNFYSSEFVNENIDKLSKEDKEKINYIKTAPEYNLTLTLFERVLKTPFNKIQEYDVDNNELIDGVSIKTRRFKRIQVEREDENTLNKEIREYVLPSNVLVKEANISRSLDRVKSKKSNVINYLDNFISSKEIDITSNNPNQSRNHKAMYDFLSELKIETKFDNVTDKNNYLNNIKKEINNLYNRVVIILEGEKVSFYKLLEKQLNLKVIHKKMAELKTKNTMRVVSSLLDQKENVMVCSMYNGVIDELKTKYPEAVVVKNKSDLENLVMNDNESKIVLSTFNKIGENVQNKFKGSLVYNDLPWNKATSEKVENSLEQKNINVFINSMEGNILDNLFVSRNNAKTENLKQLFAGGEKYEQLSDNDFKELMIKNVFTDYITNIDEKYFQEIKNSYEHEVQIYKTITLLNQDLSF